MKWNIALLASLSAFILACGGGGGNGSGPAPGLAAPSGLTVVAGATPGELDFTWTRPTGSFDGYEFEAKVGSEAFTKIHQGLLPSSWDSAYLYLDETAPDNTAYAFRMRAAKGTTYSSYSNEATYLRGPNAPSQPSAAYDWDTSSVRLTWTRNTTGSDGLKIERAECTAYGSPTSAWLSLPVIDPLASSYSDSGVASNVRYTYRITNLHGTRASTPSASSGPVLAGLDSILSVYTSWDSAAGGVKLTWYTMESHATGVKVERVDCDASGTIVGTWVTLPVPDGTTSSYLDASALEAKVYRYRMSNLHGQAASLVSPESYPIWIPLLSPTNLQVVATQTGMQLTWQNRSQVATEITVRRSPSYTYTNDIAILSPGSTSYEDPVTALGYYTYTIVTKGNGQEAYSNPAAASTPNRPDSLHLTTTPLGLPQATDASIRPAGTWAYANGQPFGILSNNDPWPPTFPPNVTRWAFPIVQVDRQGWPHALYAAQITGSTDLALTHLWYNGSVWQSELLLNARIAYSSANAGWTFRLDSTGTPHVLVDRLLNNDSFGGTTTSLTYVHKVGGTWVAESMASASPSVSNIGTFHISLEDTDVPHVLLGNWGTVIDYVRTGEGTWTSTTLPTGAVSGGWYDFLDSIWVDARTGWVFYESYLTGGSGYGLWVLQMKDGVWGAPKLLGAREHDGSTTTAQTAISPDRSRIAVLFKTSAGLKCFHQDAADWHETFVAPPATVSYWLRIGFDGNQKVHILTLGNPSGYTEYHE